MQVILAPNYNPVFALAPHVPEQLVDMELVNHRRSNAKYRAGPRYAATNAARKARPGVKERIAAVSRAPGARRPPLAAPSRAHLSATRAHAPELARSHAYPYSSATLARPRAHRPRTTLALHRRTSSTWRSPARSRARRR
jgi:hypothetical protein